MQTAELHASLSKAKRNKVGACFVTATGVIIPGYNGLPKPLGNVMETIDPDTGELITKPEVIHAEENCLLKAAKEGISCKGGRLYITLAPCKHCASMWIEQEPKEVVYKEDYRDMQGVALFKEAGILCRKL